MSILFGEGDSLMPRFSPEKWKPEYDSSPGVFQLDPGCVVLLRPDVLACPCGCGELPRGVKATFCMGHDARFRGILIRAHLMGVEVRWARSDGALTDPSPAMELAKDLDWKEYLLSAELRRDGKNRELLRRALKDPDLLKAGRWDYTGGQVVVLYKANSKTGMMNIEYVNQAGEIRKARIPASEAPLASEEKADGSNN